MNDAGPEPPDKPSLTLSSLPGRMDNVAHVVKSPSPCP